MKKSILTLSICLIAVFVFAQAPAKQDSVKRDTTIRMEMNINQFRAAMTELYKTDANIDSKSVSKNYLIVLDFLQKSAQIVQPSDKPKK